MGAVEREVDRPEVGAALRIAERLPLEHVLAGNRYGVGDLRRQRQLVERPEQFLGLDAGRGEALLQVERVLRIRDAVQVAAEEQRLAPVQRMAAELEVVGAGADVEAAEHEGVEDLARRAFVQAVGVVAVLLADVARDVGQRRVRVRLAVAVVGGVVPAGNAQARAEALAPDDVELGQDVQPRRGQVVLVEAVGAFVADRRIADLAVTALDARGEVAAEGVVPAQRDVGVADVDLEGLGRAAERCAGRGDAGRHQAQGRFVMVVAGKSDAHGISGAVDLLVCGHGRGPARARVGGFWEAGWPPNPPLPGGNRRKRRLIQGRGPARPRSRASPAPRSRDTPAHNCRRARPAFRTGAGLSIRAALVRRFSRARGRAPGRPIHQGGRGWRAVPAPQGRVRHARQRPRRRNDLRRRRRGRGRRSDPPGWRRSAPPRRR